MTRDDVKKVVVAEKDANSLNEIASHLTLKGYQVFTARDGSKALEISLLKLPDLLVVDADLPVLPTPKLIQILRSNPRTRDIPVIYLSEEERSIPTFTPGKDDFVRKPFNMSEFLLRVAKILNYEGMSTAFVSGDTEVSGKLSHVSLPDILQMFALNRRTGVLHVESKDISGSIYLEEGEVISAISGQAIGEKAFFRLIAVTDGEFQFVPGKSDTRRTIHQQTNNLIFEGVRRLDEQRKLQEEFSHLSDSIELLKDPKEIPISSNPIVREVLMLLEFYSRIDEILNAASYPDYEVYKVLYTLKKRGFIRVGKFERREKKREFLSTGEIVKLRSRIEAERFQNVHSSILGKLVFFIPDDFVLNNLITALNRFSEFELDKYFFTLQNRQKEPLMGTFGYLNLGEKSKIALLSFRTRKEFSPLWHTASNGAIGTIVLLKDEVSSSIEDLLAVTEFARVKGIHSILGIIGRDFSNFGLGDNFIKLLKQRVLKLGSNINIREVERITPESIQDAVRETLELYIQSWEGDGDRPTHTLDFQ